jgi:hypothetical protein
LDAYFALSGGTPVNPGKMAGWCEPAKLDFSAGIGVFGNELRGKAGQTEGITHVTVLVYL